MAPLRMCVALGPPAIYLLLLGAINLSRRPLLVSGGRDAAALALGLSGLVIVGPLELLLPVETAAKFGDYVWLLLVGLYAMCTALYLLTMRPRLVVYNISMEKIRPVLAELVNRLDAEARWAGDSLSLPSLGVHLYVDGFPFLRSVSLIAAGGRQTHAGWRRLESGLRAVLADEENPRNLRALPFLIVGGLLLVFLAYLVSRDPQAAAGPLLDLVQALLKLMKVR